jgi:hypothetical protein
MRGCVQSPATHVFDRSASDGLEKEMLCKPNTVQASRHGGQPRASISRMRALVAFVLLAGLFVAAAPRAANAASLHVWTSTYWADQICPHEGSESVCKFCSGAGPCFNLLQINGQNFRPYGPVIVTVENMYSWLTVSSGLVYANSQGKITFKTDNVRMICGDHSQILILVQAYQIYPQNYSDVALTVACDIE